MACHVHTAPDLKLIPPPSPRCRFLSHPSGLLLPPRRRLRPLAAARGSADAAARRRDLLLLPPLAVGTGLLLSAAAAWGAEEKPAPAPSSAPASPLPPPAPAEEKKKKEEVKAEISSRVYDATAIGEPQALGKDKGKVWEKLLGARVVYMGEAETVPDRDDRALELEIVRTLRDRCFEQQRPVSLALEIFPSDQQDKLNLFMSKRIDGEVLRSYNPQWPSQLWQEYEPLLSYCRDNGVRLVACGTPLEVLRTVQSEGIRGLPKAQRKIYAPPVGSGVTSGFVSLSGQPSTDKFSSNQSVPFAPYAYLSAQTRAVDDYAMSQVILNAMNDGGSVGMLLVITGASHVIYGSRGIGIPARISKKLQKKNQAVILLDPERQHIRREGEAPVADFLWYSAAKPCNRNCFDRAEISRVMNAAGRRRDALPQDLQDGLDLGLVSPEILQNFFDLEQYPFVSELIHRFQGFRERLLVDPKFLHRLAIEEAISISTTLLAQYERRKERFFEEIDYVITDTLRGSVVDFFTVWLPAPTISFLSSSSDINVPEKMEVIKGFLGSIPDNAFQKVAAGRNWDLNQRFASVIVGGLKLAGVGFVSSLGAGSASSILYGLRRFVNPGTSPSKQKKATPLLKSAVVYACFLGTSANLRYQVIAGIVEHRISDELLSYYNLPILVNAISFVVRTINSYWGTQQWVDLARLTGLQPRKLIATDQLSGGSETPGLQPQKPITTTDHLPGGSEAPLACNTEANVLDDINSQSGDPSP